MSLNEIVDLCRKNWQKLMELDQGKSTLGRVFNGSSSGERGLVMERFDGVGCIVVYDGINSRSSEELASLGKKWSEVEKLETVVVKRFVPDRSHVSSVDSEIVVGSEWSDPAKVFESGIPFFVELNQGFSTGVFLDQKVMRNYVKEFANNKRVLNCFSYSGLFSLFALYGNASSVVSVDISKRYLEWGKRNIELGADSTKHKSICRDALLYLQTCQKKGEKFDFIIVDPPSFARVDGRVFQIEKEVEKIAEWAFSILNPSGQLYFSNNYQGWKESEFQKRALSLLDNSKYRVLRPLDLSFDVYGAEQKIHRLLLERLG